MKAKKIGVMEWRRYLRLVAKRWQQKPLSLFLSETIYETTRKDEVLGIALLIWEQMWIPGSRVNFWRLNCF